MKINSMFLTTTQDHISNSAYSNSAYNIQPFNNIAKQSKFSLSSINKTPKQSNKLKITKHMVEDRKKKMYSNFKEQAIEYVKQVVQEDNAGNHAKAFPLYMDALEYFKTHLKYEKNPKIREE
ncbi:hypothetical protein HN51_059133 [Arachis hypogaea]